MEEGGKEGGREGGMEGGREGGGGGKKRRRRRDVEGGVWRKGRKDGGSSLRSSPCTHSLTLSSLL